MKSKLLIIIVIVAFAFLLGGNDQAYALCIKDVNYDAKLKDSELVFTGTVTRLDNYDGPQKVTFFVHDVVKGEVDTPKFILKNSGLSFHDNDVYTSSSTDVDYKIGKTYKVYVENGMTDRCTTKLTSPPADYIWEPDPEDGNYYSDEKDEIPSRQYQDANERESYRNALDSGSIVFFTEPPKLSDRELDGVMDELLHSELDRSVLPIASIAIDYEKDTLVLWTPDLTIGDKVQKVIGDVSFVLLYEEAPPRWTHDGPAPEPMYDEIPSGAIVDCVDSLHFNGTTCVPNDVLTISYGHQWALKIILIIIRPLA